MDDQHFGGIGNAVDKDLQQATVNLFADMGVQPGTLQSDLISATLSADVTPPASIITSPANASSSPVGTTITIAGTASDVGGVVGRCGSLYRWWSYLAGRYRNKQLDILMEPGTGRTLHN